MAGHRQRIKDKKTEGIVIEDIMAFGQNKSSDNARKIEEITERIKFDIWFDKHYFDRQQHGDENGKREGIEIESVKQLVIDSLKHLIYYSFKIKYFYFIYVENSDLRGQRVVLQKEDANREILNIIMEIHVIDLSNYEITVYTAMKSDKFKLGEGQFVVKLYDEDNSELLKLEKGKLLVISSV